MLLVFALTQQLCPKDRQAGQWVTDSVTRKDPRLTTLEYNHETLIGAWDQPRHLQCACTDTHIHVYTHLRVLAHMGEGRVFAFTESSTELCPSSEGPGSGCGDGPRDVKTVLVCPRGCLVAAAPVLRGMHWGEEEKGKIVQPQPRMRQCLAWEAWEGEGCTGTPA